MVDIMNRLLSKYKYKGDLSKPSKSTIIYPCIFRYSITITSKNKNASILEFGDLKINSLHDYFFWKKKFTCFKIHVKTISDDKVEIKFNNYSNFNTSNLLNKGKFVIMNYCNYCNVSKSDLIDKLSNFLNCGVCIVSYVISEYIGFGECSLNH